MRDAGYLPHALLNFTLLLGWNPGKGNEQEIFTKEEMLALFSLEGIQKSPAVFNYEKLNLNEIISSLVRPHLVDFKTWNNKETGS